MPDTYIAQTFIKKSIQPKKIHFKRSKEHRRHSRWWLKLPERRASAVDFLAYVSRQCRKPLITAY